GGEHARRYAHSRCPVSAHVDGPSAVLPLYIYMYQYNGPRPCRRDRPTNGQFAKRSQQVLCFQHKWPAAYRPAISAAALLAALAMLWQLGGKEIREDLRLMWKDRAARPSR
ncbi:MAG TPA: hypothetical protein VLT85_10955, partial [Terriglobales bacterium]|nr:hypothetical protein [Terriglobales bacterium]